MPLFIVTVLPLLEQAPEAITETARPEDAVGLTSNELPKVAGLAGCAKVMVWFALFTGTARASVASAPSLFLSSGVAAGLQVYALVPTVTPWVLMLKAAAA